MVQCSAQRAGKELCGAVQAVIILAAPALSWLELKGCWAYLSRTGKKYSATSVFQRRGKEGKKEVDEGELE